MFDTRFRTLATPLVISWIYRGCLVAIALMTAWSFLIAWWIGTWRNAWLWGVLGMVLAPIVGFVWVLIVRVACEAVLVRFRPPTRTPPEPPTRR